MNYFLYPQLRKLSGAERLILRLAAHVAELGTPITLVTNYFDVVCRPALNVRVRLIETGARARLFQQHYLDAPIEYLYSIRLLGYIGDDADAIAFFGPPSLPALFWSKVVKRRAVPHLYFCYEPPRFIYDDTREVIARLGVIGLFVHPFFALYKILDRVMVQRADVLLANSAFGAQRLRTAYARDAIVITHGVDLVQPTPAQVDALRECYHLEGKRILLTVNFLHPRKRIDLFLRAFQLIHAKLPDTIALVVGAGPEATRLLTLARELNLGDAVIFTKFVPDEELPAFYALATLYLHTAKLESFGLSVLEAGAAGVPVVAVNEGGPREIIVDGKSGMLVQPNPAALAEASIDLLQDEIRRAAMGVAAQQRVAGNYTWARGAEIFLKTLREASSG